MILIFTGDGKGKTTAALGMALRAWGQGKKVLVLAYLKANSISGEFKAIERINSPYLKQRSFGRPCPYPSRDCCPGNRECIVTSANLSQQDYYAARQGLIEARTQIDTMCWELIVLDEIINLFHLFPDLREEIIHLTFELPAPVDLVLTGRSCPGELAARADLITEMTLIKHPFEKGITAKRGIDY